MRQKDKRGNGYVKLLFAMKQLTMQRKHVSIAAPCSVNVNPRLLLGEVFEVLIISSLATCKTIVMFYFNKGRISQVIEIRQEFKGANDQIHFRLSIRHL